jgi:hypothetical protein
MRMVIVAAILGTVFVASPGLLAIQEQDTWKSASLDRAFPQNGSIRMILSAGDYEISGGAADRIHVEWSVRDADQLPRVRTRVDVRNREATITTDGPSNRGLRVQIRVPQRSDVNVRLTAGDLRLEDIRGNKDIELHAGDVRIDVGRAEDYHAVSASVWAGDIHAQPFHVIKGGLFRSFDWSGKGPYRLHAKLKAGDLRLYSKAAL